MVVAQLIPIPDMESRKPASLRYEDGAAIWYSEHARMWKARWADGTPLCGDNDEVSYFATCEEAARCLVEGGEGPARDSRCRHPMDAFDPII